MAENMRLNDGDLQFTGSVLVAAASGMTSGNVRRPAGDLPSVSGIGGAVTRYLQGVNVARAALADAARTGGEAVARIMSDSSELDRQIAQALGDDFALTRGSR
jgi:hypothetical protein